MPSWREACGVGADDRVGAERLADRADLAGAVAEVHAVEAEAGDEAEVVGHHERHVAGVRHGRSASAARATSSSEAAASASRRQAMSKASRSARHPVGQARLEGRRGDQIEPAARPQRGHQRRRIERPA